MKTGGTRTSLRQAEAKARISQIDSPAGSSPPFEPQWVGGNNNWASNPDRAEERRIVRRMIAYLHDDQYIDDKIDILRFLCREWTTYSPTMHTQTTMDAVKRKLLGMKVRYINRTSDGTWLYWTTYDDIMEFVPYSSEKSVTEPAQLDQAELTDTAPPAMMATDITEKYYLRQPPRTNPNIQDRQKSTWTPSDKETADVLKTEDKVYTSNASLCISWTTCPSNCAEKAQLLENIVEYLFKDPTLFDNIDVLRFLYRTWPTLKDRLRTSGRARSAVRLQLELLNVRYLQRMSNGKWAYWHDFTKKGIADINGIIPVDAFSTADDGPEGSLPYTPGSCLADNINADGTHALDKANVIGNILFQAEDPFDDTGYVQSSPTTTRDYNIIKDGFPSYRVDDSDYNTDMDDDNTDMDTKVDNIIMKIVEANEVNYDYDYVDSSYQESISSIVAAEKDDKQLTTNVPLTLTKPDGSTVITITDKNSEYPFVGLPPRNYTLTARNPPGYPGDMSDYNKEPDGDVDDASNTLVPDIKIVETITPGEYDKGDKFIDKLQTPLPPMCSPTAAPIPLSRPSPPTADFCHIMVSDSKCTFYALSRSLDYRNDSVTAPDIFCGVTTSFALTACLKDDVPADVDDIAINTTHVHSSQGAYALAPSASGPGVLVNFLDNSTTAYAETVAELSLPHATKIIVEEFVGRSLPPEYKFHDVNGEVVAIDITAVGCSEPDYHAAFDKNWHCTIHQFGCFEPGGDRLVDPNGSTVFEFTPGKHRCRPMKKDLYICDDVSLPDDLDECLKQDKLAPALDGGNSIGVSIRFHDGFHGLMKLSETNKPSTIKKDNDDLPFPIAKQQNCWVWKASIQNTRRFSHHSLSARYKPIDRGKHYVPCPTMDFKSIPQMEIDGKKAGASGVLDRQANSRSLTPPSPLSSPGLEVIKPPFISRKIFAQLLWIAKQETTRPLSGTAIAKVLKSPRLTKPTATKRAYLGAIQVYDRFCTSLDAIERVVRGWFYRTKARQGLRNICILQSYSCQRPLVGKIEVLKIHAASTSFQAKYRGDSVLLHFQFILVDVIILQTLLRRWRACKSAGHSRDEGHELATNTIQAASQKFESNSDDVIAILIHSSFLWHDRPLIKPFQNVAQTISFLHTNTEVSNDCIAILTKVITLVASEPDGKNCCFTDTATEACCEDSANATAAEAVKSFCVNVDSMAPSITCAFFLPQDPFHFIDGLNPCQITSPPFPPEGNLLHINPNRLGIAVTVWYQIEMQALDSVLYVHVHVLRNSFSRSNFSFLVKCHNLPKIVHRTILVYLAPDRFTKLCSKNVINSLLDMTSIRSNRTFSMLAVPATMLADANEFSVAPSFAVRRGLAMDSMAVARSSHMGHPLTGLEMTDHPKDPKWIKRDRLILSVGQHSSTLLYSWYLGRFPFPIDALQNFRQFYHSLMTPVYPEFPHSEQNTWGMNSTTDPLGQDVANTVGLAASAKMAATVKNAGDHNIIYRHVYVLIEGDSSFHKGVTSKATCFAAHKELDKMAGYIHSEDNFKRYVTYGSETFDLNGHNLDDVVQQQATIGSATGHKPGKPTFMKCITIVGTAGTNAAHGEDGVPGIDKTEKDVDFPETEQEWHVSQVTHDFFAAVLEAKHKASKTTNPALAIQLDHAIHNTIPIATTVPVTGLPNKLAPTHVSGKDDSIEFFKAVPPSISGSADLQESCCEYMHGCGHVGAGFHMNPAGYSLLFGICEHMMGSIPHGFASQHGRFKNENDNVTASVSIFLIFIHYLRPIPIGCFHDLLSSCSFLLFSALQYQICIVSPRSLTPITILQSMGG
jgi:transketolase N-terminal domain/subunit